MHRVPQLKKIERKRKLRKIDRKKNVGAERANFWSGEAKTDVGALSCKKYLHAPCSPFAEEKKNSPYNHKTTNS